MESCPSRFEVQFVLTYGYWWFFGSDSLYLPGQKPALIVHGTLPACLPACLVQQAQRCAAHELVPQFIMSRTGLSKQVRKGGLETCIRFVEDLPLGSTYFVVCVHGQWWALRQ